MYTIQFDGNANAHYARLQLLAAIEKDGRFEAQLSLPDYDRKHNLFVAIKPVRLREAKPYCGNHPGPCVVGEGVAKKIRARYLEWDDWVAFHGIINATLDALRLSAYVWSTPFDVKGKMWIRKGLRSRVKWDYTEDHRAGFRQPIRVWNQGTDDQFGLELPLVLGRKAS